MSYAVALRAGQVMETLRFLMVTSHFPPSHLGGDAMYVKYLAEGLVREGHEVHVIYAPGAYRLVRGKNLQFGSESTSEDVHVHPYSSRFQIKDPLMSLTLGAWGRAERTLKKLATELHPDVVHWHNTKGFIATPTLLTREISLYTAHDYYSVCPRSNLVRPGMIICERPRYCQLCLLRWKKPPQLWRINGGRVLSFPKATMVICPSEFVAKRLQRDGVKVTSVLRNFVPDPMKDSSLGKTTKRNLIMYLGMLERHKGVRRLLDAFVRSMSRHEFELSIVGNGSIREELQSEVRNRQLQHRVTVHGFLPRSEVIRLLQEAAVLVVPSEWHENAPLVTLEAFACGTVVLGSDLGGLPEILTEQSGSTTFQGGNAENLATELIRLWDERAALPRLGRRARQTYEDSYSPRAHIAAYLRLLQTCGKRN